MPKRGNAITNTIKSDIISAMAVNVRSNTAIYWIVIHTGLSVQFIFICYPSDAGEDMNSLPEEILRH